MIRATFRIYRLTKSEEQMKRYLISLALLAGCAAPQPGSFGGAQTQQFGGKSWSISYQNGQLAVVSLSGGLKDPEHEHRAAALDHLLRSQRGCSLGNGGPDGQGRYVYDYACS